MGHTRWSNDHYEARATFRAETHTPVFKFTEDIRKGVEEAKTNRKLDPKGVKVRESRDSENHPTSTAVAVLFDVTGSMSSVPPILQKALPKLMGLLIKKGYLEHPQIMVGGIGDANAGDKAPLQIGQFESGIEIEQDLENLYLEGGGGSDITESYELAMYFMARHTSMDCFEKRNKKGYLFLIGDEIPYPEISKRLVKEVIGDTLQSDIKTSDLVNELKERFNVYYIMPKKTSNYGSKSVIEPWKKLLGQNVLMLEEPEGVCELIAAQVALMEGTVEEENLERDLIEFGASKATAKAVHSALVVAETPKGGKVIAVPTSAKPSGLVKA